ncbi:MAG TPA: hypothetical protein VII23_00220 [Terriglobales bacterium]
MFLKRRISVVLITLWLVALASPLVAQEKFTTPLIPREVLFGNPERTSPQISPDGTQLGYLAPVDGVLNVWIRTLGKSDDRAVTADAKRGIRNFTWQYDNQHVFYTQDVGGDADPGSAGADAGRWNHHPRAQRWQVTVARAHQVGPG